jgi:hypothetical protein
VTRSAWGRAAGLRERQRIAFDRQVATLQSKSVLEATEALRKALRDAGLREEQ